ncbi:MAG: RluA family pseudouridine synthase [Candidatus Omnitrophota bacterium]|nr:RluA family pseudouridine synthase [Candidatus Omnitrophota bacterium]
MEKDTHHFEVAPEDKGKRLDKFLVENLSIRRRGSGSIDFSRVFLQKLISGGHVLVRGKRTKASRKILPGEHIEVKIPPPVKSGIKGENIKLKIVYEDKEIIIVNKPVGMVVHPAPGSRSRTLVNALLGHCKNLSGIGGVLKPGIVHRIDKDVSGLLAAAKTDRAHRDLAGQFKDKTASRVYYAVVKGVVQLDNGIIDLPIGRSKRDRKKMAVSFERSRDALTKYKVLERFKNATLLEVTLGTGRTHQIRVHLSYIGHPILGDIKYGTTMTGFSRPALHAKELGLTHPVTKKYMRFRTELPVDMKRLIEKLRKT